MSFEGSYANDVPQGRGTLRIDDVVLTRRVEQGLSGDGRQGRGDRRAAPSCGPVGNAKPKVADR